MGAPKLWTKDFLIVSVVNFFLALVFYLLIVIMSQYTVIEFHASMSQSGLVTGIMILGILIGRLFTGWSIDYIGRKRSLFIGIFLYILAMSLYFFHFGFNFFLFTRFLNGLALGIGSTAANTIVAQIIPEEQKGEGIGYYSMSAILSTALGPFIGIYLSQNVSYTMIFSLCLIISIVCLITASFLKVPPIEVIKKTPNIKGFKPSNLIEPKAVPIALVILVLGFCYSGVLTFINSFAIVMDLVKAANYFFLLYSIAILFSRPFTGRYMDRRGANYVMYPAFVLFSAGLFLLSSAHNGFTLLLSSILIGLGFGNMQSCTQAIAIKIIPANRIGLAASTFSIFLDTGLALGSYLIGVMILFTNYSTLYALLGFVVLVSSFLYFFLYGKKERKSFHDKGFSV
jgi:MFS family permease